MTDHSRRRSSRPRLRNRRCLLAAAVAVAALAAPASALAADPPTITSVGINALDQLYGTYTVAAGTTFDFIEFATVPDPSPSDPSFFADNNFAAFCSSTSLNATCTTTAYTAQYPRPRDRRYFAKVTAAVTGAPNTYVTSAVWVIDDAKPQIPGDAPLGASPPTNTPIAGHPLGTAPPPAGPPPIAPSPPPAPPAGTPGATLKLLSLPKTIGALLTKGVRVRVTCTVTCSAFGRLTLGSAGSKSTTLTGGGTRTLTVKPKGSGRTRLRGKRSARVKLAVAASPFGGTTKKLTRTFTVRR